MGVRIGSGNLLLADVDALVNTVNTKGVMGKGLALQFKKAFPDAFRSYEQDCKAGVVETGKMHVARRLADPYFIINFPTKKHWRNPSRMEYVQKGLDDLIETVKELKIRSIAIPPLGCGNGGLDWADVRPLIECSFSKLPDVDVLLYPPADAPSADSIVDRRKKPRMTAGRASVISLMGKYVATGYEYQLSLVEVQKLAYFLQLAGEPLRLDFKKHYYGPYSETLQKVLRHMEGHYTLGLGAGNNSPETPLEIMGNSLDLAGDFLASKQESLDRLEKVASLIEGFETPFGMELLGTVHWSMANCGSSSDFDCVLNGVKSWSERKAREMEDGHIRAAWDRLAKTEWVQDSALQ